MVTSQCCKCQINSVDRYILFNHGNHCMLCFCGCVLAINSRYQKKPALLSSCAFCRCGSPFGCRKQLNTNPPLSFSSALLDSACQEIGNGRGWSVCCNSLALCARAIRFCKHVSFYFVNSTAHDLVCKASARHAISAFDPNLLLIRF